MTYEYWTKALAGEKPKMFVDQPELGFFRKKLKERDTKGNWKHVGWSPVAVFMNGGTITGRIGNADLTGDALNEAWSYFAQYPISEATYRAVAESGQPWPDSHQDQTAQDVFSEETAQQVKDLENPPEIRIAKEIAAEKEKLAKYATIDSDEMSSKARSLQQRFLDLRSEAEKAYEALNRPLLDQQKRIRAVWNPLKEDADTSALTIRKALGAWEDTKRAAAKRTADEEARKAREHVEAVRKAEAENAPPPPPPEEVKPNTPPPLAQIKGGNGRAASVKVEVFVTAIDFDQVVAQFKGNPDLTALLTTLAQKAIRAGIAVPGATTEERSIVR